MQPNFILGNKLSQKNGKEMKVLNFLIHRLGKINVVTTLFDMSHVSLLGICYRKKVSCCISMGRSGHSEAIL